QRPGMTNVFWAFTTVEPRGGGECWPTLTIELPLTTMVLSVTIRPSVTSTILTCVIASVRVWVSTDVAVAAAARTARNETARARSVMAMAGVHWHSIPDGPPVHASR